MHRLFVYGSLKQKRPEPHRLEGAQFIGFAKTAPTYKMGVSSDSYPGAMPGGGQALVGEVYSLDETLLRKIDKFEGNEYRRVEIETPYGPAWMYQLKMQPVKK